MTICENRVRDYTGKELTPADWRKINRRYHQNMRMEQREILCWLLRDHNWHTTEELFSQFRGCLYGLEAAGAIYATALPPFNNPEKTIQDGEKLIFHRTLVSLVRKNHCETELRGQKRFVKLVSLSNQMESRLEGMRRFHNLAYSEVDDAVYSEEPPTPEAFKEFLWSLDASSIDPRARAFLVVDAADWYSQALSGLKGNDTEPRSIDTSEDAAPALPYPYVMPKVRLGNSPSPAPSRDPETDLPTPRSIDQAQSQPAKNSPFRITWKWLKQGNWH